MFQEHHILELLERIERQNEQIAQRDERIELQDDLIVHLERENLKLAIDILRELHHLKHPKTITKSVANVFSGENMADNVLVLNVGQSSIDTLTPRAADGSPSGGVVSNVAVQFSDPSATAEVQADGTIKFTGVAASTGPVSGSSSCTVTDTDGAVSQWTVPFTVQVNAPPPPTQLTQSVANVFSNPTP